jgi:hypothetical protein
MRLVFISFCKTKYLFFSLVENIAMAPPQSNDDPPEIREIVLSNVANQGLGYYDKSSQLVLVSDVNLQLVGT